MTEYKCDSPNNLGKDHKWKFHTAATWTPQGVKPTYLICEYCHKEITAPELMQIIAVKKQTTSTRVLIITTIIAFAALIVSIISLVIKIQ